MEANATTALLHFLVSGDVFFEVVERITGVSRIGHFDGRVYRMLPNPDHHDTWHDDAGKRRLLAMSVNLSTDIYNGGVLQMRQRESRQILDEVANTGFGDAIIFRVARHLEHRVSNVEGEAAKTAFAGWFFAQPEYRTAAEYRLFGPDLR
jgi:hypothetical protein